MDNVLRFVFFDSKAGSVSVEILHLCIRVHEYVIWAVGGAALGKFPCIHPQTFRLIYANTHWKYKAECCYWKSPESLISPANFTSFDRELTHKLISRASENNTTCFHYTTM